MFKKIWNYFFGNQEFQVDQNGLQYGQKDEYVTLIAGDGTRIRIAKAKSCTLCVMSPRADLAEGLAKAYNNSPNVATFIGEHQFLGIGEKSK